MWYKVELSFHLLLRIFFFLLLLFFLSFFVSFFHFSIRSPLDTLLVSCPLLQLYERATFVLFYISEIRFRFTSSLHILVHNHFVVSIRNHTKGLSRGVSRPTATKSSCFFSFKKKRHKKNRIQYLNTYVRGSGGWWSCCLWPGDQSVFILKNGLNFEKWKPAVMHWVKHVNRGPNWEQSRILTHTHTHTMI